MRQLDLWGFPPRTPLSENAALVVTELVTNAVVHGGDGTPGGDFHLRLELAVLREVLRVEVTDAAGERLPDPGAARSPGKWEEGGRGLVLVAAVADRCGVKRGETGKTVWAELSQTPAPCRGPA
ncbi:ATP-binding protein [Streptomyces sp. ST2-7A]|uniref:ATP-binding protein n=1 Tax=Streptomyces sp. ST2-7A TaxID=2907214 RepID=UPI001F37F5F3|nr:ATP-binding protein [Streptomyces sp. ST2-7A]MCE7081992.1 ATP-binding protein [Streptomyces sp. ST2-7A]